MNKIIIISNNHSVLSEIWDTISESEAKSRQRLAKY